MTDLLVRRAHGDAEATPEDKPGRSRSRWLVSPRADYPIALITSITSWSTSLRASEASVDDAWRYGVLLAARRGADFGADVIYTYGPLVFLDGGAVHSFAASAGAMVVRFVLAGLLAILVLRSLRARGYVGLRAWVTAWVAVVLLVPNERFSEVIVIVAAGWICHELLDSGGLSVGLRTGAAMGAGLWFTVKPSAAIVLLAVVVIASFATPGTTGEATQSLRSHLARGASHASVAVAIAGATMLVAWSAAGQSIGSIRGFLSGFAAISSGFAEAMAHPVEPHRWIETILLVLAGVCVMLIGRWFWGARGFDALVVLTVIGGLLFWGRQVAFARPDAWHIRDGAVLIAVLGLVIAAHIAARSGLFVVVVACLLVANLSYRLEAPALADAQFPVAGSVTTLLDDVKELVDGDLSARRETLAQEFAVPAQLVTMAVGQTVHVSPYDTNVAFAYPDIDLWLLPTIQHYVSFTEELESINAEALAGPGGPDLILHHEAEWRVDQRHPAWDSPRLIHTMWCGFEPIAQIDLWTVLEARGLGCAPPVRLGQIALAADLSGRADATATVQIPRSAHDCAGVVTMRIIDADRSAVDAQLLQLVRPPKAVVTTQNNTWPLTIGTASQPHILAAPPDDQAWLGATPSARALDLEVQFKNLSGYFGSSATPSIVFECWSKGE